MARKSDTTIRFGGLIGVLLMIFVGMLISAAIVMASYNYVGPKVSPFFTGKSEEDSKAGFVELGIWESLVLVLLATALYGKLPIVVTA